MKFPAKTITFVHAKLKQKERQDIIDAFQENSANAADVLIGPMGILGTGYTLIWARQIVMCDPEWVEWKGTQAEFRIHRYRPNHSTHSSPMLQKTRIVSQEISTTSASSRYQLGEMIVSFYRVEKTHRLTSATRRKVFDPRACV